MLQVTDLKIKLKITLRHYKIRQIYKYLLFDLQHRKQLLKTQHSQMISTSNLSSFQSIRTRLHLSYKKYTVERIIPPKYPFLKSKQNIKNVTLLFGGNHFAVIGIARVQIQKH